MYEVLNIHYLAQWGNYDDCMEAKIRSLFFGSFFFLPSVEIMQCHTHQNNLEYV